MNTDYSDECVTATQAAPWINNPFKAYGITVAGETAGVIATMGKESGEFKCARHHFGSPSFGQGTRNMQSAKFNLEYAQSTTAIKDQVASVNGHAGRILET
ncbi:MAG: hypothetical protein Q9164_001377 [Protoblastenia rupestris]